MAGFGDKSIGWQALRLVRVGETRGCCERLECRVRRVTANYRSSVGNERHMTEIGVHLTEIGVRAVLSGLRVKHPGPLYFHTMRRAPNYSLDPSPPQVRKRKSYYTRPIYYYFLFKQAWPLILVLVGMGLFLNYLVFTVGHDSVKGGQSWGSGAYGRANLALQDTKQLLQMKASSEDQYVTNVSQKQAQGVQRLIENSPLYGFVLFGSYRMDAKSIAAIGLSGVVLRDSKKLGACLWKEHAGGHRVSGQLHSFYPGEHHNLKYETLVMICTLEESTEHDLGGDLLMNINGEDILVYQEDSGAYPVADPKPPFKYHLTYCSPPITQKLNVQRMYEWIEYHLKQGVNMLTLYDAGGVDEEVMGMLDPYSRKKLVEVVNVRKIVKYESWLSGAVMVLNDCAYRTRFTSAWTLSMDMNEYFDSDAGLTLAGLLGTYKDKPYVTLGSRWWSIEKCLPKVSDDDWAIERMPYHWPHIYCVNKDEFPRWEMCLDYYGYRKHVVNPRKVFALQIHKIEVPSSGGEDVDTDVARLNRWHGLLGVDNKTCSHVVSSGEVIDWWSINKSLVDSAKIVKSQAIATIMGVNHPYKNSTV